MATMRGVIRKIAGESKGYGFLRSQDGANDYFFHRSDVVGGMFEELNEGDTVEFEEGRASEKGLRAAAVRAMGARVA